MGEIFVVVEHRKGEIREITFEMLFKARELCRTSSHNLTAILIGGKDAGFVDVEVHTLTLGICHLFIGHKPNPDKPASGS